MEELVLITRSYKFGDYQVDLVIENNDGKIQTDVWLCKLKEPAMKLWLFGIKDKTLDEVLKEVEETLKTDDTYISGFNDADEYVR